MLGWWETNGQQQVVRKPHTSYEIDTPTELTGGLVDRMGGAVRAEAGDAESQLSEGVTAFNADWAWRPDVWREMIPIPYSCATQEMAELGKDVKVFHDSSWSTDLTLHQSCDQGSESGGTFGLNLDIGACDASFVSVVIDLPAPAIRGLCQHHILHANAYIKTRTQLEAYFRLNIRHGPNKAQALYKIPHDRQKASAAFDLADIKFNPKQVDKAWVDLIFEAPRDTRITLRDLTFSRRTRAQI